MKSSATLHVAPRIRPLKLSHKGGSYAPSSRRREGNCAITSCLCVGVICCQRAISSSVRAHPTQSPSASMTQIFTQGDSAGGASALPASADIGNSPQSPSCETSRDATIRRTLAVVAAAKAAGDMPRTSASICPICGRVHRAVAGTRAHRAEKAGRNIRCISLDDHVCNGYLA